jgi:hypothetical protein
VITRVQIGVFQLSPAVIGVFFFIIVTNRALGRIHRTIRLSQSELMVIYSMMLLAAMASSRGLMEMLIPPLVSVNYFANEANEWTHILSRHIKPELVPFDTNKAELQLIAKSFYENVGPNPSVPWRAWIPSLFIWSIPITLIFFGFVCVASVISRQWVDNEKLAFPLVQLPLEIVRDSQKRTFFSNRLMWLGFAIPAIVFSLNGLHNISPVIPHVNLRTDLNQYFTEKPFSAMYRISLNISFV